MEMEAIGRNVIPAEELDVFGLVFVSVLIAKGMEKFGIVAAYALELKNSLQESC